MSRYLAAFLGCEQKNDFSDTLVPNIPKKAKNTPQPLPALLAGRVAEEFSPFSVYSGARVQKNAFLKAGAPETFGSPVEHVALPAEPCRVCDQSVWWQPLLGDNWRCDICDPHPEGWPPARTIDLDERLAIVEEALLPATGTAERTRVDEKQVAMLSGLAAASRKRPPLWWHREPHTPMTGTMCTNCGRRTWWSRDGGHGWCCGTCHPHQGCERVEVGT